MWRSCWLEQKNLERQLDQLKNKVAQANWANWRARRGRSRACRCSPAAWTGSTAQQMRALADSLRNKWKSAVVVLASADDSSVAIVSAVTKDLTAKVHAGKLAGSLAQALGGKGGGRPDMAEAGGKDVAALSAALDRVYAQVEAML